jgi:integrase
MIEVTREERDQLHDQAMTALIAVNRTAKAPGARLGPGQVNQTIETLAQILEAAQEYGILDPNQRNPARGRRRRMREPKPQRSWVEAEQLPSLLEAAKPSLRALLSTLAGAGLRVGEAVALNWSNVNLATGTIRVGKAKTDAGTGREVDLPLGPADELRAHRARCRGARPSDPVFVNQRGRRQTVRNVEKRIKTAIRKSNLRLTELGIEPISERVTPHSLRRTYASLRAALGDDPVYIAEQIGHTDVSFTLRVYAKAVKRRERLNGAYLREFDKAEVWGSLGTRDALPDFSHNPVPAGDPEQTAWERQMRRPA